MRSMRGRSFSFIAQLSVLVLLSGCGAFEDDDDDDDANDASVTAFLSDTTTNESNCTTYQATSLFPAFREPVALTDPSLVVNGVRTSDYPATVLLFGGNGSSICTGTFVSSSTLLTASHCVNNPTKWWGVTICYR